MVPHQDGLASIGWDHTHGWQFSEDVDLASGKHLSFGGRQAFDIDGSNQIRFSLNTAGGELLSFPSADGNADEILKTNGSGQLSFTSLSSAVPVVLPLRFAGQMGAALAANNNLSGDSAFSAFDVDSQIKTADNASAQMSVFVNGQLLQSGSGPMSTDVSGGSFTSGDYLADTLALGAMEVKFSFDLEAGDVVQVVVNTEGR